MDSFIAKSCQFPCLFNCLVIADFLEPLIWTLHLFLDYRLALWNLIICVLTSACLIIMDNWICLLCLLWYLLNLLQMNPCPASQSFTLTLQEQIQYCYSVHGRCHKVLIVRVLKIVYLKNVCKNIYRKIHMFDLKISLIAYILLFKNYY